MRDIRLRIPNREPTEPGDMLEELRKLRNLTTREMAKSCNLSHEQYNFLEKNMEPVTEFYAQRLAEGFETTPEFWLNLQYTWDAWISGSDEAIATINAKSKASIHQPPTEEEIIPTPKRTKVSHLRESELEK